MSNSLKRLTLLVGTLMLGAGLLLAGQEADSSGYRDHGMHGMHESHGFGHAHLEHVFDELDLSDTQRDRMHEILDGRMSGELGDAMQALRRSRRDLGRMIHDPSATEKQILDNLQAISILAEQTALEKHRMFLEVHDVLNEEQQMKAKELMEQMAEDRDMPRKGRRPHGH